MLNQAPLHSTCNFFSRIAGCRHRARGDACAVARMRRDGHAMIRDLDPEQRAALETRIDQARELDDFWHLRAQLFGAIALEHGEREAHARLRSFDAFAN